MQVNMREAKDTFSSLVAAAERGEEVFSLETASRWRRSFATRCRSFRFGVPCVAGSSDLPTGIAPKPTPGLLRCLKNRQCMKVSQLTEEFESDPSGSMNYGRQKFELGTFN